MVSIENTVLILLAAGRSERFGDVGSKLDADFLGRPLGLHVSVALEAIPFRARVAVTGRVGIDYAAYGYDVVPTDDPRAQMSHSVRLGVEAAERHGADAVLIALADMPRVTATHIHRLFDAAKGRDDIVIASSDGRETKPPGLFGRSRFDFLKAMTGDQGGRDLVRSGRHVVTAPAELIDVDTPEQLERLRALVGSREAITRPEPASVAPIRGEAHRSD
jgi:molybdenum cofactor cytidylyltransferase